MAAILASSGALNGLEHVHQWLESLLVQCCELVVGGGDEALGAVGAAGVAQAGGVLAALVGDSLGKVEAQALAVERGRDSEGLLIVSPSL